MLTCNIYSAGGQLLATWSEHEIKLNPQIRKAVCSGGWNVGSVAIGCLTITVPGLGGVSAYPKGYKAELIYGGNVKIGTDYFVEECKKAECVKLPTVNSGVVPTQMWTLTCYDRMKATDETYLTLTESTYSADVICNMIETATGLTFESGAKCGSGLIFKKEDIKAKTCREILAFMGAYLGCNWFLRHYNLNEADIERITRLTLDYSGSTYSALANAKPTTEGAVTFSRVISRAGSEVYDEGDDSAYILSISCKHATSDSNGTIYTNISGKQYKAFSCACAEINAPGVDIGDSLTIDCGSNVTATVPLYNYTLTISNVGLYINAQNDVQKKALPPDNTVSTSGGGGMALDNVVGFAGGISGGTGIVELNWSMPSTPVDNVIIKRKKSTAFNNIFEGDVIDISNGTAGEYHDTPPDLYHSWHYRTLTNKGALYNGSDNGICIAALSRGKYLYNMGDLCTTVTGGWGSGYPSGYSTQRGTASFNATEVVMSAYRATAYSYYLIGMRTASKVDFSGFSKIAMEFEVTAQKTYDVENDSNWQYMLAHAAPHYSYADAQVSDTDYPYVYTTYRNSAQYYVFLCKQKAQVLLQNGLYMLNINNNNTGCVRLAYTLQTAPYQPIYNSKYALTSATRINVVVPAGQPNLTHGDYMGGYYDSGLGSIYYADDVDCAIPPEARVWVGTLDDIHKEYDFINMISKKSHKWSEGLGEYTMEASIADIDNTVNPPITSNYVVVGAFDSDVHIKAVWLQE